MIARSKAAKTLLVLIALPIAAATSCGNASHNPPPPLSGATSETTSSSGVGGGSGGSSAHSSSAKSSSSSKSSSSAESSSGTGGMGAGGAGGGQTNDPCVTGKDCVSGVCTLGLCQAHTCIDAVKNGNETDVDCGGTDCPACVATKTCLINKDCDSSLCAQGVCQAATCTDNVKNGTESDIDCGGLCPNKCVIGKKCANGGDCVSMLCNGTCACPAGMVVVPAPLGNGAYCIDATEVTYAQYEPFWANSPVMNQVPSCLSWNDNFTPTDNWPAPITKANFPVTNVDWCDALAYCTYAGKHLCGKIGGGPSDPMSWSDKTESQWYNACTAQGTNVYPYGQSYQSGACEGADQPILNMAAQFCAMPGCKFTRSESDPTISACLGGAPGLLQMSGNVAEWEDSCDGHVNPTDACLVRGGSHCAAGAALACNGKDPRPQNYTGCDVGFRCCL